MVENSTIREFIIEGGDFNKSFVLKDILIVMEGFLWVKRCKMQLGTIFWVCWIIIFNKGEWVGDVPVVELNVEKFMII